jgi:hypothetical protein
MQIQRSTLAVLCIYLAPALVYGYIFGPDLSRDHERWAEFGSAIAGIYAPIVALTTLAVLARQTKLQAQINNHQYDQTYILQARAEVDFYATRLSEHLQSHALPGITIKAFLHQHFQGSKVKDLDDEELRRLALSLELSSPQIFAMWTAIYPIFVGLESKKDPFLAMTLMSAIQRLIALLSFETCVCLENYHRVRTEGKLTVPYKFSPLLPKRSGA